MHKGGHNRALENMNRKRRENSALRREEPKAEPAPEPEPASEEAPAKRKRSRKKKESDHGDD